MVVRFLSDDWFEMQGTIKGSVEGLQINEKLAAMVANLVIENEEGELFEACFRGGFLEKGHGSDASATITLPEMIAYKGLVLGDTGQAVGAMMSGKVKVEGSKTALMALASARPTETQKEFTKRLKEATKI